ncbi:HipA domain-containing protein [Lewinella sp. LCG006]|uniref:HipA domain-containing protein n=1 Tax=Lewinella sp. LCG006 TaxID=3231911 RepID=UPI0034601AD3
MSRPVIKNCPGTLAPGHDTYSATALKRVFNGRRLSPFLPYASPSSTEGLGEPFADNQRSISISGVQEKFSVILDKNHLRLTEADEQGTHILKPIPRAGRFAEQMPANEHLTMQIARQVFGIETAENALIFFNDGAPAYLTKRFDVSADGHKIAQEDFASLAGRTPQTHGEDYKYQGHYYELFELLKKHVPAYKVEALKLFKLILFNYLFSNGDAHFKNFSLSETPLGDFILSPAYDLLNSRIHIDDADFALAQGLIPDRLKKGGVLGHFHILGELAGLTKQQITRILKQLTSQQEKVLGLIQASFLDEARKRSYQQHYEGRVKKLGWEN